MLQATSPVTTLPENLLGMKVSSRAWRGASVAVAEFRCAGPVIHRLPHEDAVRLSAVLEEVGGTCEPRVQKHQSCCVPHVPRHMTFVPADAEVWGYGEKISFVKDATMAFDVDWLADHQHIAPSKLTVPKLRFSDDSLWSLVNMLANAIGDTDPSSQLFGDGLVTAIIGRFMSTVNDVEKAGGGLAPWQLQRVVDYLDEHLSERIELAQLAALVSLSQAHFSRSFKVSTGMPPYRWQLHARIRRAQTLIRVPGTTLDDVASATGFADAAHFGRMFRRFTGSTPAAWRAHYRK
jgi:AraC family transcriptional regulator